MWRIGRHPLSKGPPEPQTHGWRNGSTPLFVLSSGERDHSLDAMKQLIVPQTGNPSNDKVKSFDSLVRSCKALKQGQKKFLLDLTEEQKEVVIDDSRYCLVKSAAGSGKTCVLVAKYLYLRHIIGVPCNHILYLSYNNRNVIDTQNKLYELCVSREESEKFTSTFHALALKIIDKEEGVWPKLLEQVSKGFDENGDVDHDRAEVFMSLFSEKLRKNVESDPEFLKEILKVRAKANGKPYNRAFVSYYVDRNNIPGSCRSKPEKEIFDFLATNGYDFAYEEADKIHHRRPDFTIYRENGDKVIYEHFAARDKSEFEEWVGEKKCSRYIKNEYEKLKDYPKTYGSKNCIFTYGGKDPCKELAKKLKEKGILPKTNKRQELESAKNDILEKTVQLFKEVRSQIVETGQDIQTVQSALSKEKGYVGLFFRKVFRPMNELYSSFLESPEGFTDFADSIVKATVYCKSKTNRKKLLAFAYDYVLVDEFQDISPARHNLLLSLREINPEMRVLAVGDDWQSIYSFSCSDLRLFNDFRKNWTYHGKVVAKEMQLSQTFRFGGEVLSASTAFISADTTLSPHDVRPGNKQVTSFVLQPFEPSDSFKTRKQLQWDYMKTVIKKEVTEFPRTSVLVLSRYSNVADWFQNWIGKEFRLSNSNFQIDSITIHKAKGLTADVVFIQECQLKSIPSIKKREKLSKHDQVLALVRGELSEEQKLMEERRLFYVAITRAKKRVFLLYDNDLESVFVKELRKYSKSIKTEELYGKGV